MSIGPWSPNAQGAEEYKLMQKVIALESQLSAVTAERDALQNALLRNGFTQCDIAACNCGSWHHRYGLPERWEEIKEALREADVLDNSVGNLPINAIKRLANERNALRVDAERYESLLKRCVTALELTPAKWRNGEHIALPGRIKAAIDAARAK